MERRIIVIGVINIKSDKFRGKIREFGILESNCVIGGNKK
jgi:hypothetical protein